MEKDMQDFPHHYTVRAQGCTVDDVHLTAGPMPTLPSAAPLEFGGPGNRWSPETLLVAAIGDCLVLTFRGVARASNVAWTSLVCDVTGTLDRVDGVTQFTAYDAHAYLQIPAATSPDLARRALQKAERTCLIANSLKGAMHFVATIDVMQEPVGASA
jgi:organic hydroperoxide reductase OsmC/OhrA